MALLVVQPVTGDITPVAGASGGDSVAHANKQRLMVVNGAGSAVTVTVTSNAPESPPQGPMDLEVEVAAGATRLIDISNRLYASNDVVTWTYSSETDVTVAVVGF